MCMANYRLLFGRLCLLMVLAVVTPVYGAEQNNRDELLVLVHGAHLTGQSWAELSVPLRAAGYQVHAVNLPGRGDGIAASEATLDAASRALCTQLAGAGSDHKVSFVAHSQGGAVVHHLLGLCPAISIEKIIYVAAVAPLNGEKPFAMLSKADDEHYYRGVVYDETSGLMKIHSPPEFLAAFSSLTLNEGSAMAQTLLAAGVDEPAVMGDGVVVLDDAHFQGIKKYYIHTRRDLIISPLTQQRIVQTLGAVETATVDSGHLPMLTQPAALADIVLGFLRP
ncbi:hypothetical protein A9Q89_08200 [Gammaproteobacteria bacterium 53_120_T64]|nr:hypothetical protein A9Q89_08200 [Gammaproteobacteria bacterium 53_120_T64]